LTFNVLYGAQIISTVRTSNPTKENRKGKGYGGEKGGENRKK
jgi:hypothetical protein